MRNGEQETRGREGGRGKVRDGEQEAREREGGRNKQDTRL